MELKKIKKMTIVERSQMLHELFPDEIPGLVDYIQDMCNTILRDKENKEAIWQKSNALPFNLWMEQVKEVQDAIRSNQEKLNEKSSFFSDQLFDGYKACFLLDCLRLYISTQKQQNWRFLSMLEILFG